MVEDMDLKGWKASDLARRAKVSRMTVTRFLRGERQNGAIAKKLAKALGYSDARRYLVSAREPERVAS